MANTIELIENTINQFVKTKLDYEVFFIVCEKIIGDGDNRYIITIFHDENTLFVDIASIYRLLRKSIKCDSDMALSTECTYIQISA